MSLTEIPGPRPPGLDRPLTAVVSRPSGRSRGEVLLLHGMMGGAWQFEFLQARLAAAGYTSLALHYRGHHGSGGPGLRIGRLSVQHYIEDARSAALQCDRPIVVGQSMGGLIALKLAEAGLVAAAVPVCALPPRGIFWRGAISPRGLPRLLWLLASGKPVLPRRHELEHLIFNCVPQADREALFARQIPESSRALFEITFGLCAVDPKRVRCPVLSIAAERDALVYCRVGRSIAKRYRGEFIELPGRGHYALVAEPGRAEVAAAIISFLERVRA